MKCKKCGYEWQTYGESLSCPACSTVALKTHSERQTLWEEAQTAEKIKDVTKRAALLFALAELGDERAQFSYAECLRLGVGVAEDPEGAALWYMASARRLYPAAAYRLSCCLRDDRRFGDSARAVSFWLRVGAEFGDGDAALELSRVFEEGEGVAPSHTHALYWLTRAAKAGNHTARVRLAKMYFSGDGVTKNPAAARYFVKGIVPVGLREKFFFSRLGTGEVAAPDEITLPTRITECLALGKQAESDGEYAIAAHIYFSAARGGNAQASFALARLYEAGNGVPKSLPEARRRYENAARVGNRDAILRLGIFAESGIGGDADAAVAQDAYRCLVAMGDAEGDFRLGELYRKGLCVTADISAALRHYRAAAKAGHAEAKAQLEKLRAAADAVEEKAVAATMRGDHAEALASYKLAAEMGNAEAAYVMGAYTERTKGGTREGRRTAFGYYRTAAEGGHLGGIYALGLCYLNGVGIARNTKSAEALLSVAANKNYEDAAACLDALKARKHRRAARRFYAIATVLYRKGNLAEALRFRTIAAKLGSARAMLLLGCHYEFGDGVAEDRVKANAWYARAIAAGVDMGSKDLKGAYLRERKKLNAQA